MSICESDNFIPIPSHDDCPRHSPYPKISPRLSNCTKNVSRHVPFPEGDIKYSLSELAGLRSITSSKSSLTSSMYPPMDSNLTSTPQSSIPPTPSSEWSFTSSSPPKEDLRCSSSPQDGALKVHHSSKQGGKASTSDKRTARHNLSLKRASPLLLLPRETADPPDLMRRATEVLSLPKVSLDFPNLPKPNLKRAPLTKQIFRLPVQNMREPHYFYYYQKKTQMCMLFSKCHENFPCSPRMLQLIYK
ncbi:hypothetical protein A6R68_24228 [Neotoma lepida]|uniref:Uncharacterized protein n=1 Tax=Neotoma lepida TaxID=56216 RepID=A0A1A6HVL8_NEOLE|nr:hypothetical protein A6R68_24228 [Neotoma lepida]